VIEIEKPTIECIFKEEDANYGKFVVEPLERGYGTTLGNSLRRILISSLPGAAVTSVKIDGILHEFSTIPGVKEDVTEIILNLKKLAVKISGDSTKRAIINAVGPKVVTAADIMGDMELEIFNPDLHIATVKEENCKFSMEICLEKNTCYCPAEEHKNTPDGYIPIDSLYTPIRKVDYLVQDTRVGQITDYDKLIIEIHTNGVISPDEALDISAREFQEYLKFFIALSDETFEGIMKPTIPKLEDEILHKDIEDLNLSVRSFNCLRRYGIVTVGDLVQKTEEEIMNLRNFGKKSLDEIKSKLAEYNLALKQNED